MGGPTKAGHEAKAEQKSNRGAEGVRGGRVSLCSLPRAQRRRRHPSIEHRTGKPGLHHPGLWPCFDLNLNLPGLSPPLISHSSRQKGQRRSNPVSMKPHRPPTRPPPSLFLLQPKCNTGTKPGLHKPIGTAGSWPCATSLRPETDRPEAKQPRACLFKMEMER